MYFMVNMVNTIYVWLIFNQLIINILTKIYVNHDFRCFFHARLSHRGGSFRKYETAFLFIIDDKQLIALLKIIPHLYNNLSLIYD